MLVLRSMKYFNHEECTGSSPGLFYLRETIVPNTLQLNTPMSARFKGKIPAINKPKYVTICVIYIVHMNSTQRFGKIKVSTDLKENP